jgi:hypothetical protein
MHTPLPSRIIGAVPPDWPARQEYPNDRPAAAGAMTCALPTMDTALKSKAPNVLPAGNRGAGKVPLDTGPAAVAHLVFGECSQEARSSRTLACGEGARAENHPMSRGP